MCIYKLRTNKSISKRFKVTHSKKVLRHKACRNHLLQKKSSKRKRRLRQIVHVSVNDKCNLKNISF